MKPVIGIVSYSKYLNENDTFKDQYSVGNNYVHILNGYDVTPISIVFDNDEIILESLELCDAFLIQGGGKIRKHVLEIISYAIKKNKPILGICMGMQAIGLFSNLEILKEDEKVIVPNESSINHWPIDVTRENVSSLAHEINIKKNTLLHKILNKNVVMVNSFHNYHLSKITKPFIISATSNDGLIEAIEYVTPSNIIIGVQWHPEIINETNEIFKYFTNYLKDKIKNE